jgi:hypothetical protein
MPLPYGSKFSTHGSIAGSQRGAYPPFGLSLWLHGGYLRVANFSELRTSEVRRITFQALE